MDNLEPNYLATNLKRLMEERELSFAALGALAGKTPQAAFRWLNGGGIDDKQLHKLAAAFGVQNPYDLKTRDLAAVEQLPVSVTQHTEVVTEDEMQLLSYYRASNDQGRTIMLDFASLIAQRYARPGVVVSFKK